jgi:hypothetical protein
MFKSAQLTNNNRFRNLMTLPLCVPLTAVIPAPAHILPFVGIRLGMAVWANQPQITEIVIRRIAISMIQFKRNRPPHPLDDSTNLTTPPPTIQQVAFQHAPTNRFRVRFKPYTPFELMLTSGRAV